MMWMRLLFAIIMGFGVITSFMAKQNNLAIFFVLVCGVTVWSMRRGKNGKEK